jgi:catalase
LEAEKKLLFMPTSLTDGIELSDDPLPSARAATYAVSFARRNQPGVASSGPTQPSTVSP